MPLLIIDVFMIYSFKLYKVYSTGCIFICLAIVMTLRSALILMDMFIGHKLFFHLYVIIVGTIPHIFQGFIDITFFFQWLESYTYLNNLEEYSYKKHLVCWQIWIVIIEVMSISAAVTQDFKYDRTSFIFSLTVQSFQIVLDLFLIVVNLVLFVLLVRFLRKYQEFRPMMKPVAIYFTLILILETVSMLGYAIFVYWVSWLKLKHNAIKAEQVE